MLILENYLKSKRVQRVLNSRPGEEGFSLVELVIVIAVLAILSAVAIPAFNNVQANARAAAVQNAMVNGLKECTVLEVQGDDTDFEDAAEVENAKAILYKSDEMLEEYIKSVGTPAGIDHDKLLKIGKQILQKGTEAKDE